MRAFEFNDWASTLGFVVKLGVVAEGRDHHPDLQVSWGKVRVAWSTHDRGGITSWDTSLAEETERLATP